MKKENVWTNLLIATFVSLLKGLALMFMWEWFITPLGVPPISICHAFGIVNFVGIFRVSNTVEEKFGDNESSIYKNSVSAIAYLILLLTGFVFKLLM